MPNWLKNLGSKVVHAIAPAAGAAAATAVGLFGAGAGAAIAVKAGIGAFIGYLAKPARTTIAPPKS